MTSRLKTISDKCKMLDELMDEWLEFRKKYPAEFDDSDDEEFEQILNPLDAPRAFPDGEHGGVPEKIHGEDGK
jgi:hypothetical protein